MMMLRGLRAPFLWCTIISEIFIAKFAAPMRDVAQLVEYTSGGHARGVVVQVLTDQRHKELHQIIRYELWLIEFG